MKRILIFAIALTLSLPAVLAQGRKDRIPDKRNVSDFPGSAVVLAGIQ